MPPSVEIPPGIETVASIEVEADEHGDRIIFSPTAENLTDDCSNESITEHIEVKLKECHHPDELLASAMEEEEREQDAMFGGSVLEALSYACMSTCGMEQSYCNPLCGTSILRNKSRTCCSAGSDTISADRTVSFSRLEIREFGMTLGNHPSATSGPPVMLDWDAESERRIVGVDEYERDRNPRRKRGQLRLSYQNRKEILHDSKGFSEKEINDAWAEALRIRKQRQETLQRGLLMMFFDDVAESMNRKYQRVTEAIGLS